MEQITTWLPLLGIVAGIVGKGLFDVYQAKRTGTDSKMPTVGDIWKRMDDIDAALGRERNARLTLVDVFRSYVHRVQTGGQTELTDEEQAALEQTVTSTQEPPR